MINTLKNFARYLPLLREVVNKEITTKYRRSILGYLWSMLNPLLMMLVVSAVFSYIFRNNIENYRIYLIIGQTFWGFFSEATNHAMSSLLDNRALLQKVYIPKYIFPLSKVLGAFVNLLYSLLAIVIVIIFTRTPIYPTITLVPIGMFYILLFCIGLGLMLSIIAVYFRDMLHLYKVMLTAWMYLTPIFYSVDSLSPNMMRFVKMNPLYFYITYFRKIILWGKIPTVVDNAVCLGWGVALTIIGLVFFRNRQDGIVLYI